MTIQIPSLVAAAGGAIVGKIRLQKMVYLLDQLGLESGFAYEYHHYGPYSADLADKVEEEVVFGRLTADQRRRQSDGVPYVVYQADQAGTEPKLTTDRFRLAVSEMQSKSATILELAATIHWLAVVEERDDWSDELVVRKGIKTKNGRDALAFDLLDKLGLPPAVADAK